MLRVGSQETKMKTKVRGNLPRDFMFGLDVGQFINRMVPIISDAMRDDHMFVMDSKGKLKFFPILDTEEPMSFTTTLNALVDEMVEEEPEVIPELIKTLQSAVRRAKRKNK